MPKPEAPALDWEAMHWAAQNFKQRWDELLIVHGRQRKPDLILGQWYHLGDVNDGEERAFTPSNSSAAARIISGTAVDTGPTKLAEHNAGEAWLELPVGARVVRLEALRDGQVREHPHAQHPRRGHGHGRLGHGVADPVHGACRLRGGRALPAFGARPPGPRHAGRTLGGTRPHLPASGSLGPPPRSRRAPSAPLATRSSITTFSST